jgi:hypothetical protein
MCDGHYILTGVAADGTTTMSAVIDHGTNNCVNANAHLSSCACAGHQVHWLVDGVPMTQNEGDLTYQHA